MTSSSIWLHTDSCNIGDSSTPPSLSFEPIMANGMGKSQLRTNYVKPNKTSYLIRLLTPSFNPTALRKAKIVYNFGLSECNRVHKLPSAKQSNGRI